jgi:tetratricopeptide (TPR) repeat protein
MKGRSQKWRAITAALGALVCLGAGCASMGSRSSGDAPRQSRTPSSTALSASEERRVEAIAHYGSGVMLELSDSVDAALPEYTKAYDLDPHNFTLGVRLAQIYLDRKDYTNAVSLLETAVKSDPSAPDLWLWLGITYESAEQHPKAIGALRQALKLNPKQLFATRELLKIYLQQGPISEAVALLDNATRQQSKDAGYWMSVGDFYISVLREKPSLANQIDRNKAMQCYQKAASISPRDPEILRRLAAGYLEKSDFVGAADTYLKLLTIRPDAPAVRENLAQTYLQAGEKDKAAAVLEEIVKRDPLRFETYNVLGDLYEELDKDENAISNYQQSLVLNPNQLEVYERIIGAQLALRRYDDAFQTVATAKEKFPTRYEVPYLYGVIYSSQSNYPSAISSFADAETLLPVSAPEDSKSRSKFYFSYGAACERKGDIEQAAKLFQKSIELNPDNDAALNYLGYMWADKGVQLNEALKLIHKAIAIDPDSGAYIDSLGWVLYKLGRYDEALPELRRAAELIKDDSVVRDHLAELLLKLGKHEEAIDQWRKAHEIEPGNKDILDKLEKHTSPHTSKE